MNDPRFTVINGKVDELVDRVKVIFSGYSLLDVSTAVLQLHANVMMSLPRDVIQDYVQAVKEMLE